MNQNEDWKQEVIRLRSEEGASWESLVDKYQDSFPELSRYQIRNKLQNFVYRSGEVKKSLDEKSGNQNGAEQVKIDLGPKDIPNPQEFLMTSLKKGIPVKDLAEALGISEKKAFAMIDEKRDSGYNVRESMGIWKIENDLIPTENRHIEDWDGDRLIRFGLMGDTQINSKYTQLTHLHRLYDFYQQEGIRKVYHTGDIDDGEQMRKGHQYELYTQGVDDHADEIVRVYPKRKDMITEFITGNHDFSMVKLAGVDIGRRISSDRKDMKYLGYGSAAIQLTDNCVLELRHPEDGTAYAFSYKPQKMIDAISGGEKPNIMGIGHYHKSEYLPYRNIHTFQTGCLQAQTPWMRGKGIAAVVGGWIIEVRLNIDGGVERIRHEFIPFYTSIREDYKNWR